MKRSIKRALNRLSLYFGFLLLLPLMSMADNRCGYYPKGDTTSVCPGKRIPVEYTRGKRRQTLVCGNNADTYVRHPQIIEDYEAWATALKVDGPGSKRAFEMRQKQPEIKWKGQVPYSVTEEWEWIDCVYGQNGSECGYHEECQNVQRSSESCDSQGRCKTNYYTERVCENVANSCWYDEVKSASQHCSQEIMTYDAKYERDPKWNPEAKNSDFNDMIPNKYDLLPGEVEAVQVFSNAKGSDIVRPDVKVGDAWNEYKINLSGSAVAARCQANDHLQLNVSIQTEKRIKKQSPNAFRLPVRFDGKNESPFVWSVTQDNAGDSINGKPLKLKLSDASAAMVALMARQSRENEDREVRKVEMSLGSNADKEDMKNSPRASAFFKNTKVRVRLVEDTWYGNSDFSSPIFMNDGDAVKTANYKLSSIQDIKNSEYWEIPLDEASDDSQNIYQRDHWLARMLGGKLKALKPNQRYVLQVSMFQKGVPFYYQGCKDDPSMSRWSCFWGTVDEFSKPLEIPFWTHKDFDERSFLQQINQFTLVDWMHRKSRTHEVSEENAQPAQKQRGAK